MIRRWFIRSFVIGLLSLCIVAWAASEWQVFQVNYNPKTVWFFAEIEDGRLLVGKTATPAMPYYDGWSFTTFGADQNGWSGWDQDATFHCIGFGLRLNDPRCDGTIPLWFPSLLSALLFWFVWRKTRTKNVGKAFPVAPTVRSGESKP